MKLNPTAIVYRYLARREYAARELVAVLTRKGCTVDEAQATVAKFSEQGLQSDARYAESLIRVRTRQGYGPVRIQEELRRWGIEQIVDIDWSGILRQVILKKYGEDVPTSGPALAKCQRFLLYRGFTHDQIRRGLKDYANQ